MPISVGAFTKGLGFLDLGANLAALAVFIPILTLISILLLRKQELARSNEYYQKIHPTEAAEVDGRLLAEKLKVEAKAKIGRAHV